MVNDPDKRAKELHSKIKHQFTRDKNTTAVLNTDSNTVIVGSNEVRLRKEQREELLENEIEATGMGHAEIKIIKKAEEINLTGTEIGSSRPICDECKNIIQENKIIARTEFKNKT
jgi:hypothetical protein